ncbi:MAG: response regulator transcription factor [Chitinophagales bacterium]|nr:response regulator transcription factor [Chitinophagales bacterium]
MKTIKIFIADDHPLYLKGLVDVLEEQKDFEVVGTAENGKIAVEKILSLDIDVVLMDITMPEMDGIEATKAILAKNNQLKVLILTMHNESRFIKTCLEIGAKGYVLKTIAQEDIIKGIHHVAENKSFLGEDVQEKLLNSLSNNDNERTAEEISNLITQRELEILKLIADGLTSQDIAAKLYISKNTVETHRKNMLSKLNVKNTTALVKIANDKGLI